MPIYEYRCRACDERFDELVRNPDVVVPCPSCGDRGAEQLLSVFARVGTGSSVASPVADSAPLPRAAGGCGPGCGCHH
jgi:putative FmdB family regulatory protein